MRTFFILLFACVVFHVVLSAEDVDSVTINALDHGAIPDDGINDADGLRL